MNTLRNIIMNPIVMITVFDDGNDEFKSFPNEWKITKKMFNGGKVELTNIHDNTIKLKSISAWKTRVKNCSENMPN